MNDPRRYLLPIVAGLLLTTAVSVAVLERGEPAQAATESPILQVAPTTTAPPATTPPTTEAPTTTAPEATTTTALPAPARTTGGAVNPPRNSYAPEPIQEIGRIEIPKIGLNWKVMHGITLRNIDHGPSHWPGTPLPGEQSNTVFAGHRTTHGAPFRRIHELVPGDEIFFSIAGVRSRYLVTGQEIVRPDRLDIVNPTPTPIATLFACHPPGSAKFRIVVRAALAQAEAPAPLEPVEADPRPAPAEPPADA